MDDDTSEYYYYSDEEEGEDVTQPLSYAQGLWGYGASDESSLVGRRRKGRGRRGRKGGKHRRRKRRGKKKGSSGRRAAAARRKAGVSRKKAGILAREFQAKGKSRQARYFFWLATADPLTGDPIDGTALNDAGFRRRIIRLLNTRTQRDTERAVAELHRHFAPDIPRVDVTFDACFDKEPAHHYSPYRTGAANAYHIRLCDDVRSSDFARDYPQSMTVRHDPRTVSHYAVIVLHEFGHVLSKNDMLDDVIPGLPSDASDEERADLFAQVFVAGK